MRTRFLDNEPLKAAIVGAVRQGIPIGTAFATAGLSHDYYWVLTRSLRAGYWISGNSHVAVREEDKVKLATFFEQIAEATSGFEAEMVEVVTKAARTVNEKTGIPEWRAAMELLKYGSTRKNWHLPPRDAEREALSEPLNVPSTVVNYRELPDEKLIELAGYDWADLLEPAEPANGSS